MLFFIIYGKLYIFSFKYLYFNSKRYYNKIFLDIWNVYKNYFPNSIYTYIFAAIISLLSLFILISLKKKEKYYEYSFIIIGIYCAIIHVFYLFVNHLSVLNGNLRPVLLNIFYGSFLQFLCMYILRWISLLKRKRTL